ncbi:MAG: T9SS type A sorting domain-containing protein [Bacteroidales bacterium]|nr:T9SS type A sorting domain-containing protein [Bacteroidales bacterium]
MSDFTIDVELEQSDGDYSATITVENVGGNTATNLVLQFVVTESKMPIVWGLTDEQHYTNRLMVPNQNGTPLDFSGSDTQVVNLDFTTAAHWDTDNCELVVFVQNNSTKEILQGTKKFMAVPLYNLDAQAKMVKHPTGEFCGSSVEPVVFIKNMGADDLTSLDIEYAINGGTPQTFAWTGNISFNLGEDVVLPEMSFIPQETNTFEFSVSNPNGQPDPNPDNNSFSADFMASPQFETATILFELKTDNYPEETTWEVMNANGDVLYSGGPYTGQPNSVFSETWTIEDADCYTFAIYDAYGDGICCAYGNGYYKLMTENNISVIEGGEFGSEEFKPFERPGQNILMADFMADETYILEGEQVTFTDMSSGSIVSWEWEFEGGDPATSTEQNPVVTYPTMGIFDVTLTIGDGTETNTITKENYIIVDNDIGIGESANNAVAVFPNPSSGKVFLTNALNASVEVFNASGVSVIKMEKLTNEVIDLSEMEHGIYFLKLTLENGQMINKKISLVR